MISDWGNVVMEDNVQRFSPMWGNWYLGERIGKGAYGSVYKAVKQEYGNQYISAVKHISIPQKGVTAEAIIAGGFADNYEDVYRHYDFLRDKMVQEINFCYELRGHTNIVSYEDSYIVPKSPEKGYDIFIRMEMLQSLKSYSFQHRLNEIDIIKLGIDICEALQILALRNMVHRDIKPGNIFISNDGNFKLGDFGEAQILISNTENMAVAGTFPYMAPEVYRSENADITSDLYSLGMVMYRLLNNNRPPFVDNDRIPIREAEKISNDIRFKGAKMTAPRQCYNKTLSSIILRACEFDKNNRWQTPYEMKNALIAVKNMIVDDETISVQSIDTNKKSTSSGLINVSPYQRNTDTSARHTSVERPAPPKKEKPPTSGKKQIIIGIIIAVVLFVSLLSLFLILSNSTIPKHNNISDTILNAMDFQRDTLYSLLYPIL